MNVIYVVRSHLKTEAKFNDEKLKELLFALLDEIGKDMAAGGYNPTSPTKQALENFEEHLIERNNEIAKKQVKYNKISLEEDEDG